MNILPLHDIWHVEAKPAFCSNLVLLHLVTHLWAYSGVWRAMVVALVLLGCFHPWLPFNPAFCFRSKQSQEVSSKVWIGPAEWLVQTLSVSRSSPLSLSCQLCTVCRSSLLLISVWPSLLWEHLLYQLLVSWQSSCIHPFSSQSHPLDELSQVICVPLFQFPLSTTV